MTKRQAKGWAYRWAADVLGEAIAAGALLAEDVVEERKMLAALQEVIAGLRQRSRTLVERIDRDD